MMSHAYKAYTRNEWTVVRCGWIKHEGYNYAMYHKQNNNAASYNLWRTKACWSEFEYIQVARMVNHTIAIH
jgi:hypothetical protein